MCLGARLVRRLPAFVETDEQVFVHAGVDEEAGESNRYIDGTTERSGRIPILRYDVERRLYDQLLATADGVDGPFPIDAPL